MQLYDDTPDILNLGRSKSVSILDKQQVCHMRHGFHGYKGFVSDSKLRNAYITSAINLPIKRFGSWMHFRDYI